MRTLPLMLPTLSLLTLSGDTLSIGPTTEGKTVGPDVVTYVTTTYKRLTASACQF